MKPLIFKSVNAMFAFNVSHNTVIPLSPISLSIHQKDMTSNHFDTDLCSSPHKLKDVKVLFAFSPSPNIFIPSLPILFPVR